jgi:hypothetical protein
VARLEAAGWVRRKGCIDDRRGSFAELTSDGLAKLDAAARGHVEAVRADLLDPLTRDQQHALREVSEALVAHLSAAPAGGSECSPEGGDECGPGAGDECGDAGGSAGTA